MEFADAVRSLAGRITSHIEAVQTEEATKTAMVMPFIQAMGYNVFDPREVTPELIADVGTKKGEKVDYAILQNGKPIMIFECKKVGGELGINHAGQLFRYFSVTETRFAVLTNGLQYQFFTDLDQVNKMDEKPFFEFNFLDFEDQDIEELKKFSKESFEVGKILSTASDLKYLREIQKVFTAQLNTPSEDFVKVIASRVYAGKFTQQVREQFTILVRRAFNQLVAERINDRLKAAMAASMPDHIEPTPSTNVPTRTSTGEQIVTTPEEWEGYFVIRAILRELIPVKRIIIRDARSYCAILLDDNNRKPICRMYFNSPKKMYISFYPPGQEEERVPIIDLDDIYKYADKLHATVLGYLAQGKPSVG